MSLPYTLTSINGIKTVFYPLKELPAVKLQLCVHAGSWYEEAASWGAFHLLEHLTCQSTLGFPNKLAIEEFKEENGLQSNAYTGGGILGYFVKGPDFSLAQAIHLLNQFAFQPNLTAERLPKEISIITQEYNDYWDSPYNRFGHAITKQVYGPEHPYTKSALGKPEILKRLTIDHLKALHTSYFEPQNMILSVTGHFDLKECQKLLENTLTPPAPTGFKLPFIKSPKTSQKRLNHHEDMEQHRLVLLWPLPGEEILNMNERLKLNLASYLLGGSARSRLFTRLREESGLVYRTGAGRRVLPQGGFFEAWCSTDKQRSKEALALMRETVYDFAKAPISQPLFDRARKFLDASTVISFDSIDSISEDITTDLFWEGKIYLPQDKIKLVAKITPNLLHEAVQKYLTPKKELLAVMTKAK